MAATYESVQSANSNDSGSLTITKPVSLAVGDWMVACIFVDRDEGSSASVNDKSGWTTEETNIGTSGNSGVKLFSKVADSADVAASDFTFTGAGSVVNMKMSGHIARVTGAAFVSGVTMSADASGGASITAPTFTPTRANTLMLGFFAIADTGGTPSTSTFAIATSNPTWTSQVSLSQGGETTGTRLTFYTATRPESTSTGTLTGTTTELASNRAAVCILALAPRIDGSVTPLTDINAYAYTGVQSAKVNAISDDVTTNTNKYTGWQNETSPTTNWINETL